MISTGMRPHQMRSVCGVSLKEALEEEYRGGIWEWMRMVVVAEYSRLSGRDTLLLRCKSSTEGVTHRTETHTHILIGVGGHTLCHLADLMKVVAV